MRLPTGWLAKNLSKMANSDANVDMIGNRSGVNMSISLDASRTECPFSRARSTKPSMVGVLHEPGLVLFFNKQSWPKIFAVVPGVEWSGSIGLMYGLFFVTVTPPFVRLEVLNGLNSSPRSPFTPGKNPAIWSKARFSNISTTTCSMGVVNSACTEHSATNTVHNERLRESRPHRIPQK